MSTDPAEPLILYAGGNADWPAYAEALPRALAAEGTAARLTREADPGAVDYIVYSPNGPLADFSPFTRVKAVLSLWAGVEKVLPAVDPRLPLVRMVDDGMTAGMVEYVLGHVMRHHLDIDFNLRRTDEVWRQDRTPPLASERTVAILGLGALGGACARTLATLGFDVRGWSRTPRDLPGIACHHGAQGLDTVLAAAEILVTLLPSTPETESIVNATTLARLPRGAILINPGRGMLVDDAALIAALDAGHLGHATLDVFRTEPLPAGHPYWRHPKVTVTPHIASVTRPSSAARSLARSIARAEAGLPLENLVDRSRGY